MNDKFLPIAYHKQILPLMVLLISGFSAMGQIQSQWDRSYGGGGWEEMNTVEETADEGYIMAGFSSSGTNDGDVTNPNEGIGDYWMIKTDKDGNRQWDARFGGLGLDRATSVKQTADGGYILGGTSDSDISGQKQSANRGYEDYWVIKTDANGILEWEQTFGGDSTDYLSSIVQTPDGGFLLGGLSLSGASGERSEPNMGAFDHWLVKISALGVLEWEQALGGSAEERLNTIQVAADGNYLLGGSSSSPVGDDVTLPLIGVKDFWFVKISAVDGSIIWQHRYGGTNEEELITFIQTLDGGYFLAGGSRSDVSIWKSSANQGIVDMWGLKIDAAGNKEWDVSFGGPELDNCYSVKQNSAGYYMMGGFSGSGVGPQKSEPNLGGWDFWVGYVSPAGQKRWEKTLGGDQNDVLFNLFQNSDGGYVLAGASNSGPSGTKISNTNGLNDFWLVKTVCNVAINLQDTMVCPGQAFDLNAYDNVNCEGCTWRWDDIGFGDSIRTIIPIASSVYRVTLTDNVGCEQSDDIIVDVFNSPTIDLGNNQTICEGQSVTLSANGSTGTYEWSTNEITSSIEVDTAARYLVTITDTNQCTATDSVDVFVNLLPVVDLGPDTAICANQTLTLDAGNPGSVHVWAPFASGQIADFDLSDPTTIFVTVQDNNNCIGRDTLEVTEIYQGPQVNSPVINCSADNNTYTLTFAVIGGDANSYTINSSINTTQTGNVFTSDPIDRDVDYSFTISDNNDCNPITITGSSDCPCASEAGIPEAGPVEICGNDTQTISFTQQFIDNTDTVEYILHDGDANTIGAVLFINNIPQVSFQTGLNYNTTYYFTAMVGNDDGTGFVDRNDGCLSIAEGIAVRFAESPLASIIAQGGTSLDCDIESLILTGQDAQPIGSLEFIWSTVDGQITTDPTQIDIEIDRPGLYQLIVMNAGTACADTTTMMVNSSADLPVVQITISGLLTCRDSVVRLDATGSSEGGNFSTIWSGGVIDGNTGLNQEVMSSGDYELIITNTTNGCSESLIATVAEDRQSPIINAGGTTFLNCETNDALLNGQVSLPASDFTLNWSTTDGNILGNANQLAPLVGASGTYLLAVTNTINGCTNTDEAVVSADPSGPNDLVLDLAMPSCFGENDGVIRIDSVIGGVGPYLFSFNENAFTAVGQAGRLAAGTYELVVQDANGCDFNTSILLDEPEMFIADLGSDDEIQLGDSLRLNAVFNLPADTFFWADTTTLSCVQCANPVVRPTTQTQYTLTAIDTNGCETVTTLLVRVKKDRLVYIPSAFSPNGDGDNDRFTIYGGQGIRSIDYVRVFNRWGALIYEQKDLQPNHEPLGWDGSFRSEVAASGVYIYLVAVTFDDGLEKLYQGDVTLFR